MKNITVAGACVLASIGFTVPFAAQAESHHADLLKACKQDVEAHTNACHIYIRGFLEGAVLTDYAVIEGIAKEQGFTSAFAERAFRTRVGDKARAKPPTYYAQFCLPNEGVSQPVVETIGKNLAENLNNNEGIDTQTYNAIKRTYPCD
ncbi:Rap1a/Tai family immunity protein [Aestuariibacter sp. AA17]|uniref:Rap1a/Tai family immunity protein n=1 Tax=Fluctibacter corallii TaxID=2984329 RepID=A0ABT3A782_9ALTE|nr:Rap1a/Tai family immunity protein [Aestuariibacter sp. AA17]MCV2884545.1 Rap1a/Tai family immunity protein [Aestuariibacter sp. AA17]